MSAEQYLREGIRQYKEENFEEAAEILVKAREADPSSSTAAFFLGLTYKQMLNYSGAIAPLRDAVTLTPKIKEALVELIEVLYRSPQPEDLVEARKWLQVAEDVAVAPPKTTFLKGLILQKENRNLEAIDAFEEAKRLDKSLTQSAEIQIALCYIKEKQLDAAKTRLQTAITMDPQSDLAGFARRYQDLVEQRIELEKPIRTTLSLMGQYNSNLLSKPNDPQRYYGLNDDEKDTTLMTGVRVDYVPLLKGPWLFNAQYAFSGSLNSDYSDTHDTISNSLTVTPGYNFGKYSLSLLANYNHSLLRGPGYKPSQATTRVGPLFRTMINQTQMLELFTGYNHKEMFEPAVSPYEDTNSDGMNAYVSWIWLYRQNGFINLRYEYTDENTDGSWGTYRGHSVSAAATVPLLENLALQLSGQVVSQDYKFENLDFDLVTGMISVKKQKDRTYSGSIGFNWKINKHTGFILQYSGTLADSNLGRKDYDKNLYTAGIEYRF